MRVKEVMQRRVITVDEGDSLGLALQLMLWRGVRHLPVLRNGRLVGVLDEHDVLAARVAEQTALAVRDAMQASEHIHPEAELSEAAAELATRQLACLPVVDAGELVGILTPTDLLGLIGQVHVPEPEPGAITAGDVMKADPITVHSGDSLLDAAALMATRDVRHVCAIDEQRRLLGVLTDRDVRAAVGNPWQALREEAPGRRFSELRVSDVMTANPRTVRRSASVADVIDVLLLEHVGALPVVDDLGRLEGILSYMDLLRAAAAGTLS